MPLTPADIHNMAFKRPPIGKRGYDEEEVDAFLDEVEQELIRLLEENSALLEQMQRGEAPGGGHGSSAMAMSAELSSLSAQLQRLQHERDRAEQNARGLQAQLEQGPAAGPAGQLPAGDGDERNARVLMMAQRTADDHMRDAHTEADALLSNARSKSEQITNEARRKAGSIESDAQREHTEAMNSLGARRSQLLGEIERLSRFAEGYQEALDSHITNQLRDLDNGGRPGLEAG
ncbi:DivIVA domain-containing protein [Mangrovihabitans endophyticus]|uniref:Cell wall synthesis protein Wag31 n=1 Tax=Mangrovihabitans endophyticus TaxID=1751298 RepID=A0A8J3BX54_9ACTN|nr:DivIVA domain-containing protein [Mangrovihabitans endophyticus]GGK76764.1 cell division initiation protein [Mangrovihabitans endophyticus]